MTDTTSYSPPSSPTSMLRGIVALVLAMLLIPSITVMTVQPELISPLNAALGALIVVAYLVIASFALRRWHKRAQAWRGRMLLWLTQRNIPTGLADELSKLHHGKVPSIPEFAGAEFYNRIEGPLGDIYLVIHDGQPRLFDVVGEHVEPMSDRAWPAIDYGDVSVVTAVTGATHHS